MKKFFNTAGPLNPAKHYALDPLNRWDLANILSLIDQEKYFLMHAPRQTGKTTCLRALAQYLNQQGRYRCICISAEAAQVACHDVTQAMENLLGTLALEAQDQLDDPWVEQNWQNMLQRYKSLNALTAVLRGWCLHNPKPLVLLLDEIDALVGLSLISVLRQLRAGYPKRPERFPQSIILCGMRHLRDYRMELGEEGRQVLSEASPFNINSDSLRLGDFLHEDIQTLYAQHTQETGQRFEEEVCERVFELTQGQPWLVNALAYEACFRDKAGLDRSKTITLEAIDIAKEKLIQRHETHLDQLMAKLQQERVHRVIGSIVSSQDLAMRWQDVEYCIDLGLVCRR
ncbi:MAG: AAA-like domain-containing protein [Myxococcota bacterium]